MAGGQAQEVEVDVVDHPDPVVHQDIATVLAGVTVTEQKAQPKKKQLDKSGISRFMRAKLDSSQQVLEGLVTEDYKLIEQGAQQMQLMSKAAEWQIIPGPVYAQYSTEFQRSAEQLAKHAKDKNIDAAGLSYMQLTMNCVSCHRYIRSWCQWT